MSGNLDKSLDEILSTRRNTARRGRGGRRVPNAARKSAAAPVGGVKKATKETPRTSGRSSVPSGPAGGSGDSKIIVSNLVRINQQSINIRAF